MRRLIFFSLVCSLFSRFSDPARGVVWSNPALNPPTQQAGALKHTGRMLYTRFQVFGGSCIWVGGPWVLTARHGVATWSPSSLSVDFPAHGEQSYLVQAIHLPPDAKVDLALLQLKKSPPFSEPVTLDTLRLTSGVNVRFGGFGNYGPAGKIAGTNRFHWGTNTLDTANTRLARFSLDKPSKSAKHEAIPALFDSGSPVFRLEGKRSYLTGIVVRVSHGSAPNVGDRATFTCLTEQIEWIKQIASDLQWRE